MNVIFKTTPLALYHWGSVRWWRWCSF